MTHPTSDALARITQHWPKNASEEFGRAFADFVLANGEFIQEQTLRINDLCAKLELLINKPAGSS